MSPKKTPARRMPILIGAAAVVVVMLGVQSRPSETAPARPPSVLVPRKQSATTAPTGTNDATDSRTAGRIPSDPTATPAPAAPVADVRLAPPAEIEGSV